MRLYLIKTFDAFSVFSAKPHTWTWYNYLQRPVLNFNLTLLNLFCVHFSFRHLPTVAPQCGAVASPPGSQRRRHFPEATFFCARGASGLSNQATSENMVRSRRGPVNYEFLVFPSTKYHSIYGIYIRYILILLLCIMLKS